MFNEKNLKWPIELMDVLAINHSINENQLYKSYKTWRYESFRYDGPRRKMF